MPDLSANALPVETAGGLVTPDLRAPVVIEDPQSAMAITGGSVTLTVRAVGARPLRYQWFHEGVEMAGETDHRLTLDHVQTAEAGAYSVRIANDYGFAMSRTATVAVTDPPRHFRLIGQTNWAGTRGPGRAWRKGGDSNPR